MKIILAKTNSDLFFIDQLANQVVKLKFSLWIYLIAEKKKSCQKEGMRYLLRGIT